MLSEVNQLQKRKILPNFTYKKNKVIKFISLERKLPEAGEKREGRENRVIIFLWILGRLKKDLETDGGSSGDSCKTMCMSLMPRTYLKNHHFKYK